MKKILKKVLDWLVFLFSGNGEIRKQAVDNGICDFGGQGRDKYGR